MKNWTIKGALFADRTFVLPFSIAYETGQGALATRTGVFMDTSWIAKVSDPVSTDPGPRE